MTTKHVLVFFLSYYLITCVGGYPTTHSFQLHCKKKLKISLSGAAPCQVKSHSEENESLKLGELIKDQFLSADPSNTPKVSDYFPITARPEVVYSSYSTGICLLTHFL